MKNHNQTFERETFFAFNQIFCSSRFQNSYESIVSHYLEKFPVKIEGSESESGSESLSESEKNGSESASE
jgi:hypothetical protein